jgi:UDP-2,3-diacylglucosamine hydrolase
MKLLAISDLHIQTPEDPLYFQLITCIHSTEPEDILVLAGDIFDFFVGIKSFFLQRYHLLFEALQQAISRNVQIHYIEGNHDFLLPQGFQNIQVHAQELRLTLAGKHFFFAHGDLANLRDYGYRVLRMLLRSIPMRLLLLCLPGALVHWIGTQCVKKHRNAPPESIRTIYRSYALEKIMQGADFVILGHCHDLDERIFSIQERSAQYINIGYPPWHGSFLLWTPQESKILRTPLPSVPKNPSSSLLPLNSSS